MKAQVWHRVPHNVECSDDEYMTDCVLFVLSLTHLVTSFLTLPSLISATTPYTGKMVLQLWLLTLHMRDKICNYCFIFILFFIFFLPTVKAVLYVWHMSVLKAETLLLFWRELDLIILKRTWKAEVVTVCFHWPCFILCFGPVHGLVSSPISLFVLFR